MTTYRLVPVEASKEMIEAAGGEYVNLERADDPSYEPREIWNAMLSAAPVPSKQSELLEAARKAADEIEENLEQEGRHAGLKSAAQTLRTAIRNYEQGGGCAHE